MVENNDVMLNLERQLEELKTLWILVDVDGSARVAVPMDVVEQPLQLPDPLTVEAAIERTMASRRAAPYWTVLVSVLRGDSDAADRVRRALPPTGRELDETDYGTLQRLNMEVPFGDWAERDRSTIFVIPGAESNEQ